jgi:2-polyprenyl-3-methyl-5-hydroxy-6-metoxy-1,4-benzoquinol methylase
MSSAVHQDVAAALDHLDETRHGIVPSRTSAEDLSEFDFRLLPMLACPRDHFPLHYEHNSLHCERGHQYAIIEGVPILLVSEAPQTHIEGTRSLAVAEAGNASSLRHFEVLPGVVDPFVQNAIGATNGSLYAHLIGKMTDYPIPEIRLPAGEGKLFLEIGCSWGRWCIAAAKMGYRPVGIDPSLKGIRAARRVATQLGIDAQYIVADGRHLPFRDDTFSQVFSYSVLQHVEHAAVAETLAETQRVLRREGRSLIQMPNMFGIRCFYHQLRRGFREARDFEVRYWRPKQLHSVCTKLIGATQLSVDGYFSLNAQFSDLRFLPRRYQAVVLISELLRRASQRVPQLSYFADSLYLSSSKR